MSAYDPEMAKALLAEAGLADGFETTLTLPPPSYARRGGEIIASQLRDVGIEAEIINVEWAQWLEQVFKGKDFGLTIVSHTEPLDIGIYARDDYYFGAHDPVMQALMTGLEPMTGAEDRNAVLRAMQERVAERQTNAFLFQLARTGVADARIRGLWENAPDPGERHERGLLGGVIRNGAAANVCPSARPKPPRRRKATRVSF